MRQAGEVTYADAHKQRRNEGYVSTLKCDFLSSNNSIDMKKLILVYVL